MPTALITVLPQDIGAIFTQVLAVRHTDLVLVARLKDRLDALAQQFRPQR